MFSIKKMKWKNWSENIQCKIEDFYEPESVGEIVNIVRDHAKEKKKLRVVGAGHSFTPLVATDASLLSLDKMQGIVHVNVETEIVRVLGGTRLKTLGPLLHEAGFAMENLGDINEQSIAGAISTGTHGTGKEYGTLSTQIVGVTLLTSTGELMEINKEKNSAYFDAVRTSLGLLGIIIEVDLQVERTYQLTATSYKTTIDECVDQLAVLQEQHRHFEFYYFPYTKTVQMKTANRPSKPSKKLHKPSYIKDILIENNLFKIMSETSRRIPATTKTVSKLAALGIPTGEKTGHSYEIFATPRLVKFTEMEYCIPADKMKEVIIALKNLIDRQQFRVHFPIECRYVKADSIWLSPAYQRDSAFIAVHMYKGMEYESYFQEVEALLKTYEGRPHWGKMHTMQYEELVERYPKLTEFLKIRNELDPEKMFVNDYLLNLLHIE